MDALPNTAPEQHSSWRFELKYRINQTLYHKIKNAIIPHMKRDYYTRRTERNRYLVRSLYFDTYDYRIFHQKMSGDNERVKLRLRTYNESFSDEATIRVEMKVRVANIMEKHGQLVSAEDYLHFMQKRHWPNNENPVLADFERYLHLKALEPQVLVDYQREGFEDRVKKGIRITFDHRVRSAHSNTLFPRRKVFFKDHHPHGVVLEIKCRNERPQWLLNLIRDYGLKLVANSKFTQGIQVARYDLYHPNGVVVVR